ncbi:hypothetical protein OAL60_00575 [bacterium]|nr:hypothetical protein [bacterium]
MPQTPMTVNPVYYESDDGQEQLADFEIQHAHQGGQVEQQIVYDDYGNPHYQIEEEESFSDEEPSGFDEYADVVAEAYPMLPDALSWAAVNLDPETSQRFNEAVDSGDPDEFMPLIEALMEDFYESEGLDQDDYETEDEPEEVTEEELGQVIQEMANSEPLGQEAAMPYLQAAIDSQGSNPLYSDWMAMTAQFHNSEISYEEAWGRMTEKYQLSDLKQMYQYLNQNG